MITVALLHEIAVSASEPRLSSFVQPLNDAMAEYEINTPLRQAAFLAQICHESSDFFILREFDLGHKYDWRIDLGNIWPGDGPRFKGRGLLPIRGRGLYDLCGAAWGVDLIGNPNLLENHPYSSRSAAWYWSECKHLNLFADQRSIVHITKLLTGGYDGLKSRGEYYIRALRVLGAES